MNSTADIKAGEEVMLTDVTRRIDAIVELLQRSPPPPRACSGGHRRRIPEILRGRYRG
jgi:hypothetical protein